MGTTFYLDEHDMGRDSQPVAHRSWGTVYGGGGVGVVVQLREGAWLVKRLDQMLVGDDGSTKSLIDLSLEVAANKSVNWKTRGHGLRRGSDE